MAKPLRTINATHADSVTRQIEHASAVEDEEAVRETLRDIDALDKWLLDVSPGICTALDRARAETKVD